MNFLKNHPFAIEAFFERSLVLTFAVTKEQLQNLIPKCVELDTYQDKWAFIAVAMVRTTGLRPKGFPKFMGNNFFLVGYRIFVRFTNEAGKRLRGLYILKSETNQKKMEILGNVFTHYNYSTIDVKEEVSADYDTISSQKAKFSLTVERTPNEIAIPFDSPFTNWKDARRFAGPLPHTFTYIEKDNAVLIVEGNRQNWNPAPVQVNSYEFEFLDSLNLENVRLANSFEIKSIPYHWKKGRIEKWP